MVRVLVTGSSTGLGLLAARRLGRSGHDVVLHARSAARAEEARRAAPEATAAVIGDLETIAGAREVARQAQALGPLDSVVHNAAIYRDDVRKTSDGIAATLAVNVLAPYILTAEIGIPRRLVYLSSGMHMGARARFDEAARGAASYSQSKLYILMLAFAVARLFPRTLSNGVDPGWVPTRMGGPGAPDDLEQGAATQAELAAPSLGSRLADATGQYFHHMQARSPDPQSLDVELQCRLLDVCRDKTGIDWS